MRRRNRFAIRKTETYWTPRLDASVRKDSICRRSVWLYNHPMNSGWWPFRAEVEINPIFFGTRCYLVSSRTQSGLLHQRRKADIRRTF